MQPENREQNNIQRIKELVIQMPENTDNNTFENLELWKRAMDLSVTVCKEILPRLPIEEKYSLSSQLRRSVQSVPANIAEGTGRYYYQDTIRFCYIARGSLEETCNHLILAKRLGYITESDFTGLIANIREIRKLISGFIVYLKQSKRGENEPGSGYQVREDQEIYLVDQILSDPSEEDFK
jgi:four helix bundle protein